MEVNTKSKKNIKKKQTLPNIKTLSGLVSGSGKRTPVTPLSGLIGSNPKRTPTYLKAIRPPTAIRPQTTTSSHAQTINFAEKSDKPSTLSNKVPSLVAKRKIPRPVNTTCQKYSSTNPTKFPPTRDNSRSVVTALQKRENTPSEKSMFESIKDRTKEFFGISPR